MLDVCGRGAGRVAAPLIRVVTLHAQPPLHLQALIEGFRLFAHIPIGPDHSLDAGFHHLRFLLQRLSSSYIDAIGTPIGIMGRDIEEISEALRAKHLSVTGVLEDGIDDARFQPLRSVRGVVAAYPVHVFVRVHASAFQPGTDYGDEYVLHVNDPDALPLKILDPLDIALAY